MLDFVIVFVTVSSNGEGEKIARQLIELKAAPCVNIIPSCISVYRWKGETCKDEESLMIIKSRSELFPKIKEIVESLHSYEVPEVIAVPLANVSEKYRSYLEGFFAGIE
jgi:periplasmic divalent cation tolerance protein